MFSSGNRSTLLEQRIVERLRDPDVRTLVSKLIETPSKLRRIDHFVSTYARFAPVVISVGSRVTDLYTSYKLALKSYRKALFDANKRGKTTEICGLTTTIGQVNFCLWCLDNGVLERFDALESKVKADMATKRGARKPTRIMVEPLHVRVSF
jgi:hypothetical protein